MYRLPCHFLPIRWWCHLSSAHPPPTLNPAAWLSVYLQKQKKSGQTERPNQWAFWLRNYRLFSIKEQILTFLAVRLNPVVKWKKRTMFWDKIQRLYKNPKGALPLPPTAPTYQSALLLSRGLCFMVRRVKCSLPQRLLLHHLVPLLCSSFETVKDVWS